MTIRHLKIFREVYLLKSITKAAEKLNITQPSVSIAIGELESFYGTKLFDRAGRKIFVNQAGEKLWQYASVILGQFDEAAEVFKSGKDLNRCTVGVNISFSEIYLSQFVEKIKLKVPELDLKITVQNNENLLKLLKENRVDFIIFDGKTENKNYFSKFFIEDGMAAICPKIFSDKKTITLEELAEKPLLMREKGSGVRTLIDSAFTQKNLAPQIIMESPSTLSLAELVKSGFGITVLQKKMAESLGKLYALDVVDIEDTTLKRKYNICWSRTKHLTKLMEQIITIV